MSGLLHVALFSPWVVNVQFVQSDVIPWKLMIEIGAHLISRCEYSTRRSNLISVIGRYSLLLQA